MSEFDLSTAKPVQSSGFDLSTAKPVSADPQVAAPQGNVTTDALAVLGEFAAAGNRSLAEAIDFVGPGALNAVLRLAGSDYQLPTAAGLHDQMPGAEGGFMDEGMARDMVQAGGQVLTPGLMGAIPVKARNVAKAPGAIAEMAGFGSAAPTAAAAGVAMDAGISFDRVCEGSPHALTFGLSTGLGTIYADGYGTGSSYLGGSILWYSRRLGPPLYRRLPLPPL